MQELVDEAKESRAIGKENYAKYVLHQAQQFKEIIEKNRG